MTSSQDFGTYPAVGETSVGGDYPATAYPAGGYATAPSTGYGSQGQSTSTKDVAKDQASNVAGGAADAAQHVAGVAKEHAGQVTAEAGRQVKHLVGQAQSELSSQAQTQQQKLAGGLHTFGDQLKSMASNSQEQGAATDLAHQAAQKAHEFAGWLEDREPRDVLNEVRYFARRRPGAFLAIALGAGLLAGRLARGLAADSQDNNNETARRTSGSGTYPSGTYATGTSGGYGSVGYSSQSALGYQAGTPAVAGSAYDLPPAPGTTGYGTGEAADWTGRSTEGLGGGR